MSGKKKAKSGKKKAVKKDVMLEPKTAQVAPNNAMSAHNGAASLGSYAAVAAQSCPLPSAERGISTHAANGCATSTPKSATSVRSSSSAEAEQEDISDDKVPTEICFPCYDILLLHAEDDLKYAVEVKKHLETDTKFQLSERDQLKVLLYDDLASTFNRRISCLREGMERCTFVFILITKTFCESELSCFLEEECLMESIENPEKKWSIVPYFMDSKKEVNYKIPFGLKSLYAYQFHQRDEWYYANLKENILKRRYIKENNEKKREEDIKKWKSDRDHERWMENNERRMKNLWIEEF